MLLIPRLNFIQPRVFARRLINSPLTMPSGEIKGIYNRHINPRRARRRRSLFYASREISRSPL